MTWGIYKKTRELNGGGFLDIFGKVLKAVTTPIRALGKTIGNAIKPGAGDDFEKGFNMVVDPVSNFVGGGAPLQNKGSPLRYNKMIPRLDDSDDDSTF